MYFLYYQKDENETFAAYKALTHKLRKCVTELPIFIYLSLLTNLAQKLSERFTRLPSPTFDFVNMSNSYEIRFLRIVNDQRFLF